MTRQPTHFMFQSLDKTSIDAREKKVLQLWREQRIFELSTARDKAKKELPEFVFYDGPPFSTGLPHYGHLLTGIIKDVIPRFKAMRGYRVQRRFGWDCHGLPVETEAEKQFQLHGADQIEKFGIERFNEICRQIVSRHDAEWGKITERIGRWVDFEGAWHTMDRDYMESVWWVFQKLFEKGLIYRDYKVLPFSWKLGTPLSNFEAGQNYQEVDDPSLIVKFHLKSEYRTYLLAWTTTPWTLIANMALTVRDGITYAKLQVESGDTFILAESAVDRLFGDQPHKILAKLSAKDLEGYAYEPLFPNFADCAIKGAFRVISDSFVSLDEGTGIVHTAPAFGESDFYACRKHGIPLVCPIDSNGNMTQNAAPFAGLHFQIASQKIIQQLKERSMLFANQRLRHRYPMCWRTDTPLIYRATKTWFVAVETLKEALTAHNRSINWIPDHIQDGRFGKWLENARDWAISRNRYWGTPIPLWMNEDEEMCAVGSIEELRQLTKAPIEDLHRHHIDDLTFEKEGKTYRRIPEVFDCWFESGAMPYAHRHYPFESKGDFESAFPADFIAEGLDQTRGWFYTLHVLAAALFDRPAFKNAIVSGIVLAEDGTKMSKRLKNYPDPQKVIERCGADAVRLYMLQSGAMRGESLLFSEAGVEATLRKVLIPWWNAYSFFSTYAQIYAFVPKNPYDPANSLKERPRHILDRWILSRLATLIDKVKGALDAYLLFEAVPPFMLFIEELTNWYIRRNRRRFWQDEESPDRNEAFQTLYWALCTLCHLAAPLTPFTSEMLYSSLKSSSDPISVHLRSYPDSQPHFADVDLEEGMQILMQIAGLGHSLRKERKLRVRQPLRKIAIFCRQSKIERFLAENSGVLTDELNVKEIEFLQSDENWLQWSVKPDFRKLGKKWGAAMPAIKAALSALSGSDLAALAANEPVNLNISDQDQLVEILPSEVLITREVAGDIAAASTDEFAIALDIELDQALIEEGIVREIVNKINTLRRETGLDVQDRIHLTMKTKERLASIFKKHQEHICAETLIAAFDFKDAVQSAIEWTIEGMTCSLFIQPLKADAQKKSESPSL